MFGGLGIAGLARAQTTEGKPLAKCKVVEINKNNGIKEVWCAPLLADGSLAPGLDPFKLPPLAARNPRIEDAMMHLLIEAGMKCTEVIPEEKEPRYPWTCIRQSR